MSDIEINNLIPDWVSNFGIDVPTPFIPKPKKPKLEQPLRQYEFIWEVPYGTRKLWIQGMKTAAAIRRFLKEGDVVFNIQINRLNEHILIPDASKHRHWVNDIELDHTWEICDLNPLNFLFFN